MYQNSTPDKGAHYRARSIQQSRSGQPPQFRKGHHGNPFSHRRIMTRRRDELCAA